MKQSDGIGIPGASPRPHISRQLYVQVEERINLRRALFVAPGLMDLRAMVQRVLKREEGDLE